MNFSEKGAGGSKAVRKFSENSSVLAETGFPYTVEHRLGRELKFRWMREGVRGEDEN